jgi:hypothetical protein
MPSDGQSPENHRAHGVSACRTVNSHIGRTAPHGLLVGDKQRREGQVADR